MTTPAPCASVGRRLVAIGLLSIMVVVAACSSDTSSSTDAGAAETPNQPSGDAGEATPIPAGPDPTPTPAAPATEPAVWVSQVELDTGAWDSAVRVVDDVVLVEYRQQLTSVLSVVTSADGSLRWQTASAMTNTRLSNVVGVDGDAVVSVECGEPLDCAAVRRGIADGVEQYRVSARYGVMTDDGRVVVSSGYVESGFVEVLGLGDDGSVDWTAPGFVRRSLGSLILAGDDGRLSALDPATGASVWSWDGGDSLAPLPLVRRGAEVDLVAVDSSTGEVVVLDPATGAEQGRAPAPEGSLIDTTPLVACASTGPDRVLSTVVPPATDAWTVTLPGSWSVLARPSTAPLLITERSGTGCDLSVRGEGAVALDPVTGAETARLDGAVVVANPLGIVGHVSPTTEVVSLAGEQIAVHRDDLTLQRTVDRAPETFVALVDGIVVTLTEGGLVEVHAEEAGVVTTTNVPDLGTITSLVTTSDLLVMADDDGTLAAIARTGW